MEAGGGNCALVAEDGGVSSHSRSRIGSGTTAGCEIVVACAGCVRIDGGIKLSGNLAGTS